MSQEPTALSPAPEMTPALPNPKRRRGALITGAVLAMLVIGGLVVGVAPNHLGLPFPGTASATTAQSTSDPQKTGCPTAVANVNWPQSPTKTLQFADANSVTAVNNGAIIQIDLPATDYRWTLTSGTTPVITAASPAGYYDAAHNTCDWRFTAQSTGTVLIQFLRRRNCAPKTICSDIQVAVPFAIKVA